MFGYPSFRPGQTEIIQAVMAGRDCLGVMPTGAGKSVTYQIPARLLGGVTLVVSPLISLMKDQVDAMGELGLRATFLNSSLDGAERSRRVAQLRAGEFELLYAAPEGIDASVGQSARLARPEIDRGRRGALHQRMGPRFSPGLPQPRGPEAALQRHPHARADRDRDAARQERHRRAVGAAAIRCTSAARFSAPTCTCTPSRRARGPACAT